MSNQHPDYDIKEEAPDNDDLSSAVSRGYDDITNVYGVLEKDRKDADTNKQERKKQDTEARGKLNKMLLRFAGFILFIVVIFILSYAVYYIIPKTRSFLFGNQIKYANEIFETMMSLFIGGVFGAFVARYLR